MPTDTETIFICWSFIILHIIVNNSCSLIDTTILTMTILIMEILLTLNMGDITYN